jgi:hypothetical protein
MSDDKKEIEIQVKEEKDGSAVVDLPNDIDMGDDLDDNIEVIEKKAEGGEAREAREVAEDDDDPDHPDDTEAMRAAKRAKRRSKKELWRNTNKERELQLQVLKRQNDEMARRLAEVEQKTRYSEMSQLDKQIEDEGLRLEYAKMKISEATAAGDGEAMIQAQEAMFEARQKLNYLAGVKNQASKPQVNNQSQQAPDPRMQHQAAKWIQRNDWYKPDLSDADSKIAKTIDEELVAEGWNPTESDYWDELDNRLQKYLPHRYNGVAEQSSPVRKPRNVVASSGREASASFGGSNRTFTLSPQMVSAIKEAGMWDNVEARNRMIRRYAQQARNMEGN